MPRERPLRSWGFEVKDCCLRRAGGLTFPARRTPGWWAKTWMKTAPMLRTHPRARVNRFPSLSPRYPVTIAPKNPPVDAAVLKAICQLALMMNWLSNRYPKSFWKEGTDITPLDSWNCKHRAVLTDIFTDQSVHAPIDSCETDEGGPKDGGFVLKYHLPC